MQVYPNSRVLVVSTENITQNWYFGEERSMLIPNCLFRIGGAGIVLSNRFDFSLPSPQHTALTLQCSIAITANHNKV